MNTLMGLFDAGAPGQLAAATSVLPDASLNDRAQVHWALKLTLLNETVRRAAAGVPYYRDVFANLPASVSDPRSFAQFEALPVLTKAAIAESPARFVSEHVECNAVRCTSGTSGKRLNVPGCREEAVAWRERQQARAEAVQADAGADLILRILPPMRRVIGAGGGSATPQMLAIYDYDFPNFQRFDFEDFIAQCLLDPMPLDAGRKVTLVHMTPPFLFDVLTTRLEARGFDPEETAVRAIILTGGPVTERARRLGAQFWKRPIVTSYSCTEINGEARECARHPGRFHFDETIHAEVLDVDTGACVPAGGDGKLILTSMHPYQQAMPLLRYDTGDVVRRHAWPCECGVVGETVEVLGRAAHCISLRPVLGEDAAAHIVGSVALEDMLSSIPGVNILPYPRFFMRLEAGETPRLVLSVEVQTVSADGQARLRDTILQRLVERVPLLGPLAVGDGLAIDIRLIPKGDLQEHFKLLRDR